MGTAVDRIAEAQKNLENRKVEATKAEQAAKDAEQMAHENGNQVNVDRASKLAYENSQASYRVSQADYQVIQAKYARDQVQWNIDRANEARLSDEKSLQAANNVLIWVGREGS